LNTRGSLTFGFGFAIALAGGWIAFPRVLYERVDQPIQFSHEVHTRESTGLTCQDCHSFDEQGTFSGIPRLEVCSPCHTDLQGKSAEEKRFVDQYVARNREVPWQVYARQPENAHFSHAPHVVLAKIGCERCHGPHGGSDRLRPFERNRLSSYARDVEGYSLVRWKPDEWQTGMKMDDCSNCHRERGIRESCLTCHK
jgi:hypothetical protein